jgi:hypothetical protein
MQYTNGNAIINIDDNGTRIIEFDNDLKLDFPLNLDIRVSTSCSFANNICKNFCHESAVVNGKDCDYELLKSKLFGLPQGIELAIGCNHFTQNLYDFLQWCYEQNYICNLTINQGHVKRDFDLIEKAIENNFVKGLGISYRNKLKFDLPESILNYKNTVFHVISGIDTFNDILLLKDKGVKKLLILGEKDFGYNSNKVDLQSQNHKEWYWWIGKLFNEFEVVSFDNLALEQLNIKRFFTNDSWDIFNQGEESFYIDAVHQTFAPSSRSSNKVNWNNFTIQEYFKTLNK